MLHGLQQRHVKELCIPQHAKKRKVPHCRHTLQISMMMENACWDPIPLSPSCPLKGDRDSIESHGLVSCCCAWCQD